MIDLCKSCFFVLAKTVVSVSLAEPGTEGLNSALWMVCSKGFAAFFLIINCLPFDYLCIHSTNLLYQTWMVDHHILSFIICFLHFLDCRRKPKNFLQQPGPTTGRKEYRWHVHMSCLFRSSPGQRIPCFRSARTVGNICELVNAFDDLA